MSPACPDGIIVSGRQTWWARWTRRSRPRIQETYSHVAAELETRLVDGL
jgi:hypothetical protein